MFQMRRTASPRGPPHTKQPRTLKVRYYHCQHIIISQNSVDVRLMVLVSTRLWLTGSQYDIRSSVTILVLSRFHTNRSTNWLQTEYTTPLWNFPELGRFQARLTEYFQFLALWLVVEQQAFTAFWYEPGPYITDALFIVICQIRHIRQCLYCLLYMDGGYVLPTGICNCMVWLLDSIVFLMYLFWGSFNA